MQNIARYRPNNRRKYEQRAGNGKSFRAADRIALLLEQQHECKEANTRNDNRGQIQLCRSGPQRVGKQPDNVLVAKNVEVFGVE